MVKNLKEELDVERVKRVSPAVTARSEVEEVTPGSRKDKSARQWENEDNICPSINWGT